MGCATSKKTDATTTPHIYRPPPSSFAIFDINSIEEPWLKLDNNAPPQLQNHHPQKSSSHVPTPLLEKLDTLERETSDGPRTWEEVSKALEDLNKPTATKPTTSPGPVSGPQPPTKNFSFHTLEELEANKKQEVKKTESTQQNELDSSDINGAKFRLRKTESSTRDELPGRVAESGGLSRSVKANPFIVRDRLEKEKEGKEAVFDKIMKFKRDPLCDFPEACPPGGSHLVVLYTTSLGGVRRTFEDCNRVRAILENHRVVFDERDVSLHGPFLTELKELVANEGGPVPVPRLFVKGRYLGGGGEVVELNESGQLGRILSSARVERGVGWQGCEGCGGARFVPCMECGGSCKLMIKGDEKQRCPKCNENGLAHCPLCH